MGLDLKHQVQLSPPEPVDFQEGWLSGEEGLQLTMKVTKRKAPWTDYDGNELFEGDIIEHPSGERGRIEFHRRFASVSDQWRVDYGDGALNRLCLQIGDKGRAVKMACGGIKEEEKWTETSKAGWQPIETAPKDGRIFATINETGHCCSMFCHDGDMVPWQQRPTFPFRPVLWSELPPEIAALSLQ